MKIIITERQLKKLILELDVSDEIKKELGIELTPSQIAWKGEFIKTFMFGDNRNFFRVRLTYNHNDGHDHKGRIKNRTRIKSLQQFNEVLKESFPLIIPFLMGERHSILNNEKGEKHSVVYENEYMNMVYQIRVLRRSEEEFIINVGIITVLPYQVNSPERYEIKYEYDYPSSLPEMVYGIDYEDLIDNRMKTYEEDDEGYFIPHEDDVTPRRRIKEE
jgi:hypothetical protein